MLLQEDVLWLYVPNVLCIALQVAAKVPMYYVQYCKKLHYNVVMHSTIILLEQKGRTLYKGPELWLIGHTK